MWRLWHIWVITHFKNGLNFAVLIFFGKFVIVNQKTDGKRQNSICMHSLRIRFA